MKLIEEMTQWEVIEEVEVLSNKDKYFEKINELSQSMSVRQAYEVLEHRAQELGLGRIYSSLDSFYMSRHRHSKSKIS